MNKLKYIKYLGAALMLLTVLSSCKKDKTEPADLTKPTANIILTNDSARYYRGESIIFTADFEDNRALAECQVILSGLKSSNGIDDPWTPDMYKINLAGAEMSVNNQQLFGMTIPYTIWSGDYQLTFKVIDEADNFSLYKLDISIE